MDRSSAKLASCSQAAPLKRMHGFDSTLQPPRDSGNSAICLKAATRREEQAWVGEAGRGGGWAARREQQQPRTCDTRLHHVEDVVVEHAAEDEVVGPLLRMRAKGKERRVVLLREELHRRGVLKRVHRVMPPQVHACHGT